MVSHNLSVLTFVFSDDLSGIHFEFNGRLDQTWIVIKHLFKVLVYEMLLNVIAHVMESTCADVRTCSLQRVCE